MKKLFAFISLALMFLSLSGCGTSMGVYADADKYLVGEQNYIEEVNTIDIDWISGKIILVEDETVDGVIIKEETDLTSEKE